MRAAFIRLKDEGGVYLRAASISGNTVCAIDNCWKGVIIVERWNGEMIFELTFCDYITWKLLQLTYLSLH